MCWGKRCRRQFLYWFYSWGIDYGWGSDHRLGSNNIWNCVNSWGSNRWRRWGELCFRHLLKVIGAANVEVVDNVDGGEETIIFFARLDSHFWHRKVE